MIRFDSITKQYPGTSRPALNAIDLEILRGEFVFLVGASGSGKSSCLRLILKEDRPSRGNIHVLGQNLNSISNRKVPYFRRNLGVVFQDFRLLPNKSVFDNVAFTLQVIGKSRGFIQEAVPDVLKMVGLAGKASRLPHELSGGEQQRVAIARAIVNKPALLLADEPTGNLDPSTSSGIMSLLERINAGGTTVIMATHEAGIVDKMQRRVIELVSGQIVRDERQGGYGFTAAIPKQSDPAHESTTQAEPPAAESPSVPELASTPQSASTAAQQPSHETIHEPHPAWPDTPAPEHTVVSSPFAPTPETLVPAASHQSPIPVSGGMPPAPLQISSESVPVPVSAASAVESRIVEEAPTSGLRLSEHFASRPAQVIASPEPDTVENAQPGVAHPDIAKQGAGQHRSAHAATGFDGVESNAESAYEGERDDYLPVPLTLAEKLGLRAPGSPHEATDEQNVGPTS